MDSTRLKTKLLREAKSGVRQCSDIVGGLNVATMELAEVRAAARQAEQTAAELNRLAGVLELEFQNKQS